MESTQLAEFRIDPAIAGKVRVASIAASPVSVREASAGLDAEIASTSAVLTRSHSGRAPAEIPGLAPARDFYRAFGIDPTRTRPSSEALLRRVLQGKPFPRILNAVDVCNLCAVEFLLPIGLYDLSRLRGEITLRRGLPGESYAGIRKEEVHLEGRPTLADEDGPFGNPTSDSLRTSVTETTVSLWMVIFAPLVYPAASLEAHARRAEDLIVRHLAPSGEQVRTVSRLVPG